MAAPHPQPARIPAIPPNGIEYPQHPEVYDSRQTLSRTPTLDSMGRTRDTLAKSEQAEQNEKGPQDAPNGAGGPPGGPPKPGMMGPGLPPPPGAKKFHHGFFDPELAPLRKIVYKIYAGTCIITILVMWICAPVYWGSLWKADKYVNRLAVRVIDRDGGAIGSELSNSLLALDGPQDTPHYFYTSRDEFPTMDDIYHDIVQEGAWASVVVMEGATANLTRARETADSTYDGHNLVQIVYAQARSETAIGSYLLPALQRDLGKITGKMSAESVSQYLSSASAQNVQALARAPTTLTTPINFHLENLRPYNQPVATAITLVGLIYMLIFSFIITMTNNACREIIAPYMSTGHYIVYRICLPLILYLPLSFFFAMINLPFKIHFGAHFTYAGGFFLWAFIMYLGMASVGFATEFMITILGPRFISFFLIPLIIVNVSVVSLPHELQPWIYRYGVAVPFYNASRAVRTIIFDTKNQLGMNCGILLAWVAVSLITIPLATWLTRRHAVNEHRRAMGEMEDDIRLPDGRINSV